VRARVYVRAFVDVSRGMGTIGRGEWGLVCIFLCCCGYRVRPFFQLHVFRCVNMYVWRNVSVEMSECKGLEV
jgi:hypothetical protein